MDDFSERLEVFARELQSIHRWTELVHFVCEEIRGALGYQTAWVCRVDVPTQQVTVSTVTGLKSAQMSSQSYSYADDVYLQGMLTAPGPIVIEDAQTHPDVNREVVTALGNRTIVNVPMRLMGTPFGVVGAGTFGDEGVHLPSPSGLEHLANVALHLAAASARIRLNEDESNSAALEARRRRFDDLVVLAGGFAHDFRNLLSVIIGNADLLRASGPCVELSQIIEAATQATNLTDRLTTLSDDRPLQLVPTDVNLQLTQIVETVSTIVPPGIRLELVTDDALPIAAADASELHRVMLNLCINAADAMPSGGTLHIETACADPAADYDLIVTVSDTGTGIDAESLESIFEPYFTTKGRRGTGLGLAICAAILEQHGGKLSVQTELGTGSTFTLHLRAATPVPSIETPTPTPEAVTGRILIADSEPHVRHAMARVLERRGYSVTAVSDGAEAVAAVADHAFDLAVLDAVMPNVAGRAAYSKIRELRPQLPILFSSGLGSKELSTRFLADLDVPVLWKPFVPEALVTAVQAAMHSPAD